MPKKCKNVFLFELLKQKGNQRNWSKILRSIAIKLETDKIPRDFDENLGKFKF